MKSTLTIVALGIAAVAGALSGCINQQKEVLRYRQILDGPAATLPASRPASPTQPLTLEAALIMADRHNDQLDITGEDYVLALIDEARAADTFLPSISFAPKFTRQERFRYPSAGAPGAASTGFNFGSFYPQNYTDLPVNTTLNTDVVRDLYDVNRAAKTAAQRKALLLDLQQTVFLNVAQTYYAILESEQSVGTLTASVALQEARVKNMTHRLEQGVARRLDVLQSQADAASARVQLTDARNQVAKGRATLAYLLGVPEVDVPLADRFNPPDAVDPPEKLLTRARAHRQDLLAAAHAVNASAAAVKSAWGQYFPSIGLNLNTFLYRESFPTDSWWTAIINVNFPIFEAGEIHNNVREAYANLRQNVDRARQTDHQVNEDIHTTYADFVASRDRIKDLQTEAQSASDAYDAASREFAAGTATNLDVLTAQESALAAKLRLDSERFNVKLTWLALVRATGMLDRDAIRQLPTSAAATQATAQTSAPATLPAETPSATAAAAPNAVSTPDETTTVTTVTTTITTTHHTTTTHTTTTPTR